MLGLSVEQCKSEAQKRLEKKREDFERRMEAWRLRAAAEAEEAVRQQLERYGVPETRERLASLIAHEVMKKCRQHTERLPVVDGVIQGPWGDAS